MNSLLGRAGARYLTRHPGLMLLSVLGIALGVAVSVGVDLANESARKALRLSVEALSGSATHQILAGTDGLDETVYVRIRREIGLREAAPKVEATVLYDDQALRVLGLDWLAEASFRDPQGEAVPVSASDLLNADDAVLLTPASARRLGLQSGDRFSVSQAGRVHQLRLVGLLTGAQADNPGLEGVLFTDIATAQERFGRAGRIDGIDLILPGGQRGTALAQAIAELLPAGAELLARDENYAALDRLTRAFRVNLTALGLLALLVGMFLIYNTMSFSVLQRRALMGSLRMLGATRGQLLRRVLLESLWLGAAGTALGLLLGLLLGKGMVSLVSRTVNDLYFMLSVRDFLITPRPFLVGTLLGLGTSLLASLPPALDAANTHPRAATRRATLEQRVHRLEPRLAILGIALLALAPFIVLSAERSLVAGLAGLFCGIFGVALTLPWLAGRLSMALSTLVSALPRAGIWALGLRGFARAGSRNGVVVTALAVAIAAGIGVGLMVQSFRASVDDWLVQSLRADIYVAVAGPDSRMPPLDDELVRRLFALPGLRTQSAVRTLNLSTPSGDLLVKSMDLPREGFAGFGLDTDLADKIWPRFERGEAVLISEPLAYRQGWKAGDRLTLLSPGGPRQYPIAAVYTDYGSDRGVAILPYRAYLRDWGEAGFTGVGLYFDKSVNLERALAQVRRVAADFEGVRVRSTAELRAHSLEVFDRTFTITRVMQYQLLLVACVGVVTALLALELERVKELAVLRATGFTRVQVMGLISTQTGFLGLIAGLMALPLGLAIAWTLIHVINRRAFGWLLELQVQAEPLLHALGLAMAAALIAGVYPAWRMARVAPAAALREE